MPWQGIVNSMDTLAKSHSLLAQRIDLDVEKPLREHQAKSIEMQGLSTIQGNLGAVAREVEDAQKKVEKLRSRGGKADATKVSNATSDLQVASQQWDSQAPYVFEQLQALDESRVNHLRDVLTQLQTHEVDSLGQCRIAAESTLNIILNVSTAEEISSFVARTEGSSYAPTLYASRIDTSTAPSTPLPSRSMPPPSRSSFIPSSLGTPRIADDSRSEISAMSGGPSRPGPRQSALYLPVRPLLT